MRCHIMLLVIATIMASHSNATIRRVGNPNPNPLANTDYSTFYAAYQASSSGDTILVWPDVNLSNEFLGFNVIITKKLIIISKGYWLDSLSTPKGNGGLQTGTGTAYSQYGLYFRTGSSGSVLMGFRNIVVNIEENHITLRRNYNIQVNFGSVPSLSNLLVEGNYWLQFGGSDNQAYTCANTIIRNNMIYNMASIPLRAYTGGIIGNNTMAFDASLPTTTNGGPLSMSSNPTACCPFAYLVNLQHGYWIFENNLLVSLTNVNAASNTVFYPTNATNTVFNHNVGIQGSSFSAFPLSGVGNIVLNPSRVGEIFEAFPAIGTASADGRYRLKANSPAKAGSSERPTATTDAGMYGGPNAYKLGMIPSIPTIYQISSPQGNNPTGNTIQINISTRSNN